MHNWFVYHDFDSASQAAAVFMADKINECLSQKDVCYVALPGGHSPVKCLAYLATRDIPWNKVHWYLGDERCYPSGHADRNDVMLDNEFWSLLGQTHIHRIASELGAEQAAEKYREEIASFDHLDIAFLGMGEDGHTASLFPDNEALEDSRSVVPVYHSPKPPENRVSLSINTLKQAQYRIVLISGRSKAAVIKRVKNDEALPVNCIGDINWFMDQAAFAEG